MILENAKYSVQFGDNGSIVGLSLREDTYKANFVLASKDEPWVPENKGWGLGFITSGFNRVQIENCESLFFAQREMTATYRLAYTDERCACVWNGDIEESKRKRCLLVTVTRTLAEDGLYETLAFKNESEKYLVLDELGLYSSFRDTYVTGENVLHTHMNQHICTAGDLCYPCRIREDMVTNLRQSPFFSRNLRSISTPIMPP